MIKQICRLCRLQMCNMFGINEFRHTKDKSKKNRFVLLAVAWSIIIVMLVAYVTGLSYGLIKVGMGNVLPMYLYAMVSILILVFTFFKAGSVLFSMKGYEMLVALPVSKTSIVVSRFMTMYVSNLLMSCLVMLPGVLMYGILCKPSFMFYVIYFIGTIFLPLLPLTIASIIGALITAISSRMRHKSVVQALLTILAVLAVLGLSMLIPDESSVSIDMEKYTEMFKSMAVMIEKQIGGLYPPALWFNKAVFGEVGYTVCVVGVPLVVFVAFISILQRYFHGICSLLNGVSSKNNYEVQTMEAHGVVRALWKKELKRYFASSIYVTNTIIGYILAVVAAVAIFVMGTAKVEELFGISGMQSVIETVIPFVLALMMSITNMTSCSISMEGKSFWILQTLPVRTKDVYFSKILANLTVATPFCLISIVFGCLTIKPDIMEYVWMIMIPVCYVVYMSVVGLTVNLAFPVLNWDNEVQVVKQSASTLVTMIVGMMSSIVPAVAVVLAGEGLADVTRAVIVAVLVGVTCGLYRRNGRKEI